MFYLSLCDRARGRLYGDSCEARPNAADVAHITRLARFLLAPTPTHAPSRRVTVGVSVGNVDTFVFSVAVCFRCFLSFRGLSFKSVFGLSSDGLKSLIYTYVMLSTRFKKLQAVLIGQSLPFLSWYFPAPARNGSVALIADENDIHGGVGMVVNLIDARSNTNIKKKYEGDTCVTLGRNKEYWRCCLPVVSSFEWIRMFPCQSHRKEG